MNTEPKVTKEPWTTPEMHTSEAFSKAALACCEDPLTCNAANNSATSCTVGVVPCQV